MIRVGGRHRDGPTSRHGCELYLADMRLKRFSDGLCFDRSHFPLLSHHSHHFGEGDCGTECRVQVREDSLFELARTALSQTSEDRRERAWRGVGIA